MNRLPDVEIRKIAERALERGNIYLDFYPMFATVPSSLKGNTTVRFMVGPSMEPHTPCYTTAAGLGATLTFVGLGQVAVFVPWVTVWAIEELRPGLRVVHCVESAAHGRKKKLT